MRPPCLLYILGMLDFYQPDCVLERVYVRVYACVYLRSMLLGHTFLIGLQAKLATASAWEQITATIRLVGDIRLLLLIPAFMSSGLTKELIQVDITKVS